MKRWLTQPIFMQRWHLYGLFLLVGLLTGFFRAMLEDLL